MPTTPIYALPYPTLTDAPNAPVQMQALALRIDVAVAAAITAGTAAAVATAAAATAAVPRPPFAQAAGIVGGFSAGSQAPGTGSASSVTFPAGRFSLAPIVSATLQGGPGGTGNLTTRAVGVTATGFDLYVYNAGASAATYSGLSVGWSAVQMKSSAAAG